MITSVSLRSDVQQELHMLNQYKSSVIAALNSLGKTPEVMETTGQLTDSLKAESSWSEVNKAELALVELYDPISLKAEWSRRLAEKHFLPPHLSAFYSQFEEEKLDDANVRALLTRLLRDLHWQRESRRVIRSRGAVSAPSSSTAPSRWLPSWTVGTPRSSRPGAIGAAVANKRSSGKCEWRVAR